MTTAFVLRKVAQAGSFSKDRVAPKRAARATLGVVLPLIAGWFLGHVEYGVYMALGALPAGLASFQGETVTRLTAVAAASIGMAISTFVGVTVAGAAPWALVPTMAVWGYLVGIAICLGDRWSVATLPWAVGLIIAVGFPAGPAEAAARAGFVLAGGLVQAALVAASWTLRPGETERAALAASYRGLATYAGQLSKGLFAAPSSAAFPAAGALDDPNPLLGRSLRLLLVDLLEEAERIRAALAALAAHAVNQPEDVNALRALLAQAAAALDLAADAIQAARRQRDDALRKLDAAVAALAVPDSASWRWSGEALLGQLRAVARMRGDFGTATAADGASAVERAAAPRQESVLASAFAALRANIGIQTEAGRHALRLAMVAGLAEAVAQVTGLPQGRWAALAVFFVLRPDYSSTVLRGVELALGTVCGAVAGAAAVELAHHVQGEMVAAAGLAVAIAYAVLNASYLFFSVVLTMYIVVLFSLLGMPAVPTAEARILAVFVGSALALTAYVLWPTWGGTTAQEKFARLAEAYRDYVTALLRALAHPGSENDAALRALQRGARRARSDAEAALARLTEEPAQSRFSAPTAELLMAPSPRFAQAALALHALVLSQDSAATAQAAAGDGAARIDDLAAALGMAMNRIAAGLRTLSPPEPFPALRPIYSRLSSDPAFRGSPLLSIADRLVDATNTLDAVARERLGT